MNLYQNKTTVTTVTLYESDKVTTRDLTDLTGEFIYGNKKDNSLLGTGVVAITNAVNGELTVTLDGSSINGLTADSFNLDKRTYEPDDLAYGHLLIKSGTNIVDTIYFNIKVYFEIA